MFKKIITVVLLIIQINAMELKVTEQGIKLIDTNKLINRLLLKPKEKGLKIA